MQAQSRLSTSRQLATHCYFVHAATDPAVMPAVAGVLAKRGLVPDRLYGTRCGNNGEEMQVDLQVTGLDRDRADLLAQALRRLVCVDTVLLSEK